MQCGKIRNYKLSFNIGRVASNHPAFYRKIHHSKIIMEKAANGHDDDDNLVGDTETTFSSVGNDTDASQDDTNGNGNGNAMSASEAPIETDLLVLSHTLADKNEMEENSSAETFDATQTKTSTNKNETELNQAVSVVFLKYIVNEVVEETNMLQEEIACQGPLIDFLNKVELRFGIVDEVPDVFGEVLNQKDQIARALDGQDVNSDIDLHEVISTSVDDAVVDKDVLKFRLVDHNPIPLFKMGKGVLLVSNQAACIFCPHPAVMPPRLHVKTKNGVTCFLLSLLSTPKLMEYESDCCLLGQIMLLSDDDSLTVANNTEEENTALITKYLLSGEGLNSPNAVFIPETLGLLSKTMLKDRLNLVQAAGTNALPSRHDSNEFRHSIIDAIGTRSDISLLQENCAAKFKIQAIPLIQNMIAEVNIEHDGGSMKQNLRDGRVVAGYHGGNLFSATRPAWVLPVAIRVFYDDVHSLKLFISGVETGAAGFSLGYNPLPDGVEKFYYMFEPYAVVKSIKSSDAEPKYFVTEIAFWLDRIKKTLNVLGIDYNDKA
eukprot:CCRYP_006097-RA/>CCRYP_006097-RA protein AED:0.06 eAED:0.06 QI:0/0/0/0.5/1/1/2/0/546